MRVVFLKIFGLSKRTLLSTSDYDFFPWKNSTRFEKTLFIRPYLDLCMYKNGSEYQASVNYRES